jgi:serine-type D-Ala-D-Ala carboxypeptidase/endopeptidase
MEETERKSWPTLTSHPFCNMRTILTTIFSALIAFLTFVMTAAAEPLGVAGIWTSTLETFYCLGPNCRPINLHLVLHVTADSAGKLGASLDSVDQGAMDLPGDKVVLKGNAFSFDIPSVRGDYKGTISGNGNSLKGTWTQGIPLPLVFTRIMVPPRIGGIWEGDLGSCPLRLVLRVRADSAGKLAVTLDSVDDQHPLGMAGENVVLNGNAFSFNAPAFGANYQATFSANGYLKGELKSEGDTQPLVFTRISPAAAPTVVPIPARPPVPLENLKTVLDHELKPVLEHGLLSEATGGGLVIGVLDQGERRIFTYGTAHPDSIFEIGSITKTFTGLILAQMTVQKKVSLTEPVRALLPPGFVGVPTASEITLLDLATQHSGLPRMPDNFKPKNKSNPYADYDSRLLGEFLTKHGMVKHAEAKFLYSNLGFGLLGYALSQRAGVSYAQLIQTQITGPLQMRDTVVTLSSAQRAGLIQGHDGSFNRVGSWDFDALAGAGGLKSTAYDMLTYLEANLHPAKYAAHAPLGSPAATLPAAMAEDHQLRANASGGEKIALAWFEDRGAHYLWHNGKTGGYSSFASFNPDQDWAVVVLYNSSDGYFKDRVGENVSALLSGPPAMPLDFTCDADKRALAALGIQ